MSKYKKGHTKLLLLDQNDPYWPFSSTLQELIDMWDDQLGWTIEICEGDDSVVEAYCKHGKNGGLFIFVLIFDFSQNYVLCTNYETN